MLAVTVELQPSKQGCSPNDAVGIFEHELADSAGVRLHFCRPDAGGPLCSTTQTVIPERILLDVADEVLPAAARPGHGDHSDIPLGQPAMQHRLKIALCNEAGSKKSCKEAWRSRRDMCNSCEVCLLMLVLPIMPLKANKAHSAGAGRMAHVRLGLRDCM